MFYLVFLASVIDFFGLHTLAWALTVHVGREDQSHHGRESHSLAAHGRTVSFCFAFLHCFIYCRLVRTRCHYDEEVASRLLWHLAVTNVSHSGQQLCTTSRILMGDNDWAEYGQLECFIISFRLANIFNDTETRGGQPPLGIVALEARAGYGKTAACGRDILDGGCLPFCSRVRRKPSGVE